ncbi:MAG: FG-GAP-like repeat-containing protein [Bacteroidota bacterium]
MKHTIFLRTPSFSQASKARAGKTEFRYTRLVLLFLAFAPLLSWAQIDTPRFVFQYDRSVKVAIEGKSLLNAWAGGLNAGQFSKIHLNNDAVEDLVVFDRTNNKLSTFLAVHTSNGFVYHHAPEYEFGFPELNGWALLADYNQDGKKDIFTHTNLGILVYKNVSAQGKLHWAVSADPIYTAGLSGQVNLQVSVSDIPSIVDVDEDGDLDVLTFNFAGGYIEYHQNQSREKYGNNDSLEFTRIGFCWGNVGIFECGNFDFGIDCGNGGRKAFPGEGLRIQHLGATLLALDLNGDQVKEILVGDVECSEIFRLDNQGTLHKANFTTSQNNFPASKPISFPIFPAVFYEDVDFDGKKDLLTSPNVSDNDGNQINFQQSAWFYHNKGTHELPDFEFSQPDFLQNTMIDLGENATPALADYDADGDLDLFVGNSGLTTPAGFVATISLFENIGNATKPEFALRNRDYLHMSAFKFMNVRPFFADINRDNSLDFCFTSNNAQITRLCFFPNTAAIRQPFHFSLSDTINIPLPLGLNDHPFPYDLDSDGDLDWLVGKSQGSLAYFQTSGTIAQPTFTLKNALVGGITPNTMHRGIVPFVADLNADGKPELLTGDRSGQLRLYENFLENLGVGDTLTPVINIVLDLLHEQVALAHLGSAIFPAPADLNNDSLPELIIGTNAGGLIYLKNSSESNSYTNTKEIAWIYPNPTMRYLSIKPPYIGEIELYTLLGQRISYQRTALANQEAIIDVGYLANGIYLLKITGQTGEVHTQRLVVSKN